MKRRLLTILLFLLAGAVVNVVVAWASAATSPWTEVVRPVVSEWDVQWPEQVPDHWPDRACYLYLGAFGWDLDRYSADTREERADGDPWITEQFVIYIGSAGWPRRSLQMDGWANWVSGTESWAQGGYRFDGQPEMTWWRCGIPSPVETWGFGGTFDRLPIRPIWSGFTANTLLYAALLWLGIRGPFALRRQLRRKRGRCPKCGYDLRGDPAAGCPECGWNREEAGG